MTATIDLPNGHLDFLKALSRPTDYQKLLIELYEKTDRTATEDKKLSALIRTEKPLFEPIKPNRICRIFSMQNGQKKRL